MSEPAINELQYFGFGQKLVDNDPLNQFWAEIGRKWSVLLVLGQSSSIMIRLTSFWPKLVDNDPLN